MLKFILIDPYEFIERKQYLMGEVLHIYHEFSDTDLLKLINKGDRAAFTVLHERYRGLLYLHAYGLTRDTEDAEDIVQDVFISLWDRDGSLNLKVGLKSYLYSAVRYQFLNMLDHKKVVGRYQDAFHLFAREGDFITDNQIREKELNRLMEKEIAKLPEKMRRVFELSRKAHMSIEQIAQELDISDKTVKRQLANAVKILRPKFKNLYSVLFSGIL